MSEKSELDRIDCEIIAALQKDARQSNKELASRVGLAASSCLLRVRKLAGRGVLRGYRADVDPKALGVGLMALIAVRLRQHSRDTVDAFRAHVLSLPEAVSIYHVAGANDFLVHVAVRDADHLRDLALDGFTRRSEVAHMETSLLFEHTHAPVLPNYNRPLEEARGSRRVRPARARATAEPRKTAPG